jgi:hypothetical protein
MSGRTAQRGAALLAMLAVIVMGAAWWMASAMATRANRVALERTQTAQALRLAKQALIAYAANLAGGDDGNPGRLPCPEAASYIGDAAQEGKASSYCTAAAGTIVGRLPWRTLGIEQLRDASGEPLWYVVSPGWALPNSATLTLGINSNTAGGLTVNGQANAAVALIIAPGPAISLVPTASQTAAGCAARSQVRTPSAPNALDYLECQNVAGASLRTVIVDNATNAVFNDQSVVVTAADVLAAVEPVVALRIQRDVVPTLAALYNTPPSTCAGGGGTQTNEWGVSFACPAGTTTNPVFPFAAPYVTTSTATTGGNAAPCGPAASEVTDQPTLASASAFKGAGCTQGLLPLSSYTCNANTNGPCDANFVQWNPATVSLNPSSGANWTSSCALSTGAQVRCDITYSKSCLSLIFNSVCSITPGNATLSAQATNVGNSLRKLNSPLGISNFGSPTMTAPLLASGAANGTIQGTIPNASCNMNALILFIWWTCTISNTVTITAPITAFADHSFLTAASQAPSTPWFWFLANKWHHVTYYAVAPLHAPGGAGNCSGASCISVTMQGSTNLSDKRAVLALAGRSVQGTAGANRALNDFLDDTTNTDLDRSFKQYRSNKFFNDRFVSISP